MNLPFPLVHLINRLDVPGVCALALMGSHARGDAGPYSDVDVVRFTGGVGQNPPGEGSFLHEGYLLVVSTVTPVQVEKWFSEPDAAVNAIEGIRTGRALLDRAGYFEAIQARAEAFVWDETMQERANRWASERMVGWIEEVHKGLEGLRRGDTGRLLNARFGLSWGLSRVMMVQRGLLLTGDNAFYDALVRELGPQSDWIRLWRIAFAIEGDAGHAPTLRWQVIAGLRLYAVTAELLNMALRAEDAPLITETSALIREVLSRP
jgi:predicted nucleotidyltransferase